MGEYGRSLGPNERVYARFVCILGNIMTIRGHLAAFELVFIPNERRLGPLRLVIDRLIRVVCPFGRVGRVLGPFWRD